MFDLELKKLDKVDKSELSMIEVAHAILADEGKTIEFPDLVNEIQKYTGFSDDEIKAKLVQFYADLNVDGSFISLGDNVWGLRTWYPYESVDEATVNETEDEPKVKKHHKINAFLADASDEDDVIDYDNDDPEDNDNDVVDYDNDDPEDNDFKDDLDDVDVPDDSVDIDSDDQ